MAENSVGRKAVALLAGSGCAAVLQGWLWNPVEGPSFRRETLLVCVFGSFLAALFLGIGLGLAMRLLGQRAAGSGWFLSGALCSLVPWLSSVIPAWIALTVSALLAAAGMRLVRFGQGRAGFVAFLAVPVLVFLVAGFQTPSIRPSLPAPASSVAHELAGTRPDILLVSVDTLRADVGVERVMPHLAALATRGISADYALAPSDVTLPSHVSLLSGLTSLDHGVRDNLDRVDPAIVWLSEHLKAAGYRTAAVVSNYILRSSVGFARGFEVFDESPTVREGPLDQLIRQLRRRSWAGWLGLLNRLSDAAESWLWGRFIGDIEGHRGNGRHTTAHARHLLEQLCGGAEPFFLLVHYMDPHTPYAPPAAMHRRFATGSSQGDFGVRLDAAEWEDLDAIGRALKEGDSQAAQEALEWARGLYLEEAAFVDGLLGELLAEVENRERQTVVLVTADHGEHFGENQRVMHGDSLYEPALRVPFVLVGPGIPATRLENPPHLEDVVPTLLSLAGLSTAGLSGIDLTRTEPPPRDHLARRGKLLAIRNQGYKLIARVGQTKAERFLLRPLELYSLSSDAAESHNLLERDQLQADRLERLAREYYRSRARPDAEPDLSAEHSEALRQLGYLRED
jgi:arylsulfatase A-like enzyme